MKFDAIICARPCSAQPTATNCPAPSRRATTPLSRPARAVGNSSHPEPPSDRFHSKLQWFLFNCLASAVECVIARLNQVSVFIHPMATLSSVLSAAKEPRLQFCCGGVVRGAPSSSAPKYEMSLPQCQVFICYDKATMRVRNVWFSPLAPQPTVRVPCVTSKWKSPSAVLTTCKDSGCTLWALSRAKALGLNCGATVDSRRTATTCPTRVARVFSTRAVTPPQVGVDPRRRRRGGAGLRVLKRQLSDGWLDFTFAV